MTLAEKRRLIPYDLDNQSINPIHRRSISIFVYYPTLKKENKKRNDPFSKMRKTIQLQAKGTIFENEVTKDFNKFAQKWKGVIDRSLTPIRTREF